MVNQNIPFLALRLKGQCGHVTKQNQSITHKSAPGIMGEVARSSSPGSSAVRKAEHTGRVMLFYAPGLCWQ